MAGVDWNLALVAVELSGLPRGLGAKLLVPRIPTCVPKKASTHIDFYLVGGPVASLVKEVLTLPTAERPHRPVNLVFKEGVVDIKQLVFRSPQKFDVEAVFGPRPPQQDWSAALSVAALAEAEARTGQAGLAHKVLGVAWNVFAATAERAWEPIVGATVRAKGKGWRGGLLQAKWGTTILRKKAPTDAEDIAVGWRVALENLEETTRVAKRNVQNAAALDKAAAIREAALSCEFPGAGLSERLDGAMRQIQRHIEALQPHQPPSMEWLEESATLIDETALELEEANKKKDHERDAGWDEWQDSALKLGAKAMHRFTRLKARWTPATTKRQGSTTADPAQLLEHEVDTLRCFWKLALRPPRSQKSSTEFPLTGQRRRKSERQPPPLVPPRGFLSLPPTRGYSACSSTTDI